jgi:hypothetical protein
MGMDMGTDIGTGMGTDITVPTLAVIIPGDMKATDDTMKAITATVIVVDTTIMTANISH